MAKRIKAVGSKSRTIRITSKLADKTDPDELGRALGAARAAAVSPAPRPHARRDIGSPVLLHEERAPSRKRRFLAPILVEVEIDERLLTDVLTDEWRQNFYPLITAADVAGHLAYNLIQGRRLQSLDGFADQPEEAACLLNIDMDEATELPCHELAGSALQVKEDPHGRKYNWQCTCGMRGVEWRVSPRQVRSGYRRHLRATTRADSPTTRSRP